MIDRQTNNWTDSWPSFLVSGVIAITASVVLGGCRFGNYAETVYQGLDTVEFYRSAPRALQFQVTTQTENRTVTAPAKFMPPIISTIMTEPVALYHFAKTGRQYITEKTAQVGARIMIDFEKSTFTWNETAANQLTDDNSCLYQITEKRDGTFTKYGTTEFSGEFPIAGQLSVKHQKSYSWTGTGCAEVLTEFYNCYRDTSGCWGNSAEENAGYYHSLHGIYDPFIEASAMSVEDIKTTRALSYLAEYQ